MPCTLFTNIISLRIYCISANTQYTAVSFGAVSSEYCFEAFCLVCILLFHKHAGTRPTSTHFNVHRSWCDYVADLRSLASNTDMRTNLYFKNWDL